MGATVVGLADGDTVVGAPVVGPVGLDVGMVVVVPMGPLGVACTIALSSDMHVRSPAPFVTWGCPRLSPSTQ